MNATVRVGNLEINKTTEAVIGAAIEVHRHLGAGLLESAYEECLCEELALRKIPFQRQVGLPVVYKSRKLNIGYRIDILVKNELVVELKAVETIHPIHEAQVLTYMRLSGCQVGLILNFHVPVLKNGIKRLVHKLKE